MNAGFLHDTLVGIVTPGVASGFETRGGGVDMSFPEKLNRILPTDPS